MSDSSDDDNDEEEEEEEEGDAEEQEEQVGDEQLKTDAVISDIELLGGIFSYIDKTIRRINAAKEADQRFETLGIVNQQLEAKVFQLQRAVDNLETQISHQQDSEDEPPRRSNLFGDSNLSWSQYEGMSEDQRAHLLERAIEVLGREDGAERVVKSKSRKK